MNNEFKASVTETDAGFTLSPSVLYQMFVDIDKTSFRSAVFDPGRRKFVAVSFRHFSKPLGKQEFLEQIRLNIAEEELLKHSYQKVHVIWNSQCATLVPAPLYDEEARKTYLNYNQSFDKNDEVFSDKLKTCGSFNVFACPAEIVALFRPLKAHLNHHASVLVESLLIQHKHNLTPMQVFINVHTAFFDMVVINDRRLLFYNSFAYNTAEDFIYFVLFTFEQLKMTGENARVTLSGEIVKNSGVYEILHKYIRNLEFAGPTEPISHSYILQDLPAHVYQNLFSAVLCEL